MEEGTLCFYPGRGPGTRPGGDRLAEPYGTLGGLDPREARTGRLAATVSRERRNGRRGRI